jgi:AcrR family transcriptional regulator
MTKAEKTRQFIVEKTAPVFNRKGYAGTSLTDMTGVTGLTKGSIYGNFENKEEVALAAYEYNAGVLSKNVNAAIREKESATEKLAVLVDYYRKNWKRVFECGGCPILNASIEADDNLPFLKKPIQKSIKNWAVSIIRIIEEGKQNGEFYEDIIAADYAYTMIALIEGGIMLAKITNNQRHLFTALDRVVMVIRQEIKK